MNLKKYGFISCNFLNIYLSRILTIVQDESKKNLRHSSFTL